ncbi:hypothetical protein [Cellulomonas sp. HZM]|uniref:hypothetical protein n=1 Tax=Cellulomonas sp. HZM TaxID=1454010 RepID=UPI0004930F03|nr:hypothetical protein [Cellulomonas sp. HZM]
MRRSRTTTAPHALRRYAPAVAAATVLAIALGAPPALAAYDAAKAHDSDKVDGKHAVSYTTKASKRAGKLVATNSKGQLPNNIIAKAPDSSKVGGLGAVKSSTSASGRKGKLVATDSHGRLPNDIIAKAPDSAKLGGTAAGDYYKRSTGLVSGYAQQDPRIMELAAGAGPRTLASVPTTVPDPCGAGRTRYSYLLNGSAWLQGDSATQRSLVRAQVTAGTGVDYGPGLAIVTIQADSTYNSYSQISSTARLTVGPGPVTFRLLVDTLFSPGKANAGDGSLSVVDAGYTCVPAGADVAPRSSTDGTSHGAAGR